MGRLGGGELSYASDIDVLFVYDGDGADRLRRRRAHRRRASCRRSVRPPPRARRSASTPASAPRGTRDRSPGRSTGSARTTSGTGSTWERQALTKARFVAGDAELGARFCALAERVRLRAAVDRRRRARGPPHEGAHRAGAHPAGRGSAVPPQARAGLAVRRRVHGAAPPARARRRPIPSCACPGTIDALERLRARGAARTTTTPTCSKRRTGSASVPATPGTCRPRSRPTRSRAIGPSSSGSALLLGYVHQPHSTLRDDYRRVTRRARRVVERIFYDA